MPRQTSLGYVGCFGAVALLAAMVIASVAEASLPTGGMMMPRPLGPARADMPASTSVVFYRIPSAVAYGLPQNGPRPVRGQPEPGDSVLAVRLPESWDARPIEDSRVDRRGFGGLHGVCVVTLCDERRLATPRPDYYSIYLSQRYEFATSEAKDKFDAHPEHYAPAFEGRDAVTVAAGTGDGTGTLRFAGYYRDRLYLFQSSESRGVFCENPRHFMAE